MRTCRIVILTTIISKKIFSLGNTFGVSFANSPPSYPPYKLMNTRNKCERLCLGQIHCIRAAFLPGVFLCLSLPGPFLPRGAVWHLPSPNPRTEGKVCAEEEHFLLSEKSRSPSFRAKSRAFRQDARAFLLLAPSPGTGAGKAGSGRAPGPLCAGLRSARILRDPLKPGEAALCECKGRVLPQIACWCSLPAFSFFFFFFFDGLNFNLKF